MQTLTKNVIAGLHPSSELTDNSVSEAYSSSTCAHKNWNGDNLAAAEAVDFSRIEVTNNARQKKAFILQPVATEKSQEIKRQNNSST